MGSTTNTWCVILAGGASARFWPVDGDSHPKYLLRPDGTRTLIEMAWERALSVADASRVMVVTGRAQAETVAACLPGLAHENLVVEPSRRDTLPAIGLGVAEVLRRGANESDVVVVTPSDSWLRPSDAIGMALTQAVAAEALDESRLCCFTVRATEPKTGFGYLELAMAEGDRNFVEVKSFVEKPDAVRAAKYVASGHHHWNTGSFACRVGAFVFAMDAAQPGAMRHLKACAEALANDEDVRARESFELLPLVSIDYGLMERAPHVAAIPLPVEFDDIGSWDALAEHGGLVEMSESRDGISVTGVDSENCAAYGVGSVAFVGCQDLVVVREGDRILVMRRGHGQSVKQARALVEEERRKAARQDMAVAANTPPLAVKASPTGGAGPGVHLGVDYGDARTGVALSDDLGLLASPLELIRERDRELVADRVAALAREHRAVNVVLGMPFNMDGTEGPRALKAREFAALLRARGVASVILHDERLTSWEAEGRLREAGHGGRERKQLLDMAAAVTILEAYLSGLRKPSSESSGGHVAASASLDAADIPWEKPGWQKPGFKRDKLSHDDRRDKNREQRARRKGR